MTPTHRHDTGILEHRNFFPVQPIFLIISSNNRYDIDSDNITQLDEHDFLGRCETSLAEIVAAPDGVLILKIKLFKKFLALLKIFSETVTDRIAVL